MFNWQHFTNELLEAKRLSNPPSERKDQRNAAKFRAQKLARLNKTIQKTGSGPNNQKLIAQRRKQFMLMKQHQRKAASKTVYR